MQRKVFSFMEFAFIPFKSRRQLFDERCRESYITWFHLNGLDGQWRPFVMGIHGDTEQVPYLECHKPYLSDITIDLDKEFTKKESASYASWPIQAYIKGFSISSSLALSFTHNEEWTFQKCQSPGNVHYFYPFTLEALGEVTLKINGGTVRAHVDEIEAGRRILRLNETWEEEED